MEIAKSPSFPELGLQSGLVVRLAGQRVRSAVTRSIEIRVIRTSTFTMSKGIESWLRLSLIFQSAVDLQECSHRESVSENMSDRWLYRIYGQEFGPVSLELVRSLLGSGAIAPDDEVRNAAQSNWMLACAATELRDSITTTNDLAVERRSDRDEWFCRGATGDYGPLRLVDLIQLAVDGELTPDEEIKAHADDYWKKVRSIQRLVELLPFAEPKYETSACVEAFKLVGDQISPAVSDMQNSSSTVKEPTQTSVQTILSFTDFEGPQSKPSSDNSNRLPPATSSEGHESEQPDILQFPGSSACEAHSATARGIFDDSSIDSLINALGCHGVRSSIGMSGPMTLDDQAAFNSDIVDALWSGWAKGEEFHSVTFSELLSWAVMGRLQPTDFVRKGDDGQYVPAVNIPALFTVRAAANSLFRRTASFNSALQPKQSADARVEEPASTIDERMSIDTRIVHAVDDSTPARMKSSHRRDRRQSGRLQIMSMQVMFVIAFVLVVWIAGW